MTWSLFPCNGVSTGNEDQHPGRHLMAQLATFARRIKLNTYTVPIVGFLGWLLSRSCVSVVSEGEVVEPEAIGDSSVNLTGYDTLGIAAI